MNQHESVDNALACGWLSYGWNAEGWQFMFRRNHDEPGLVYDYLTVYPSGRVKEGIRETCREKLARKRRGILFRDFRDYPHFKGRGIP
jgi:hypothetical protein